MQVEHTFSVPLPVAEAWDVLLDVDRIAPCLPGATVEAFDGEVIEGHVKVKLGPIQVNYSGTATFVERDASARRIVVEAKGTETRGEGTALATVVANLHSTSARVTEVRVVTDLILTGRPAQFSRSVLVSVGQRLVDRFAQALAEQRAGRVPADPKVDAPAGTGAAARPVAVGSLPTVAQPVPTAQASPHAATSSAGRLLAVGAALLVLGIGWRVATRRRR